MFLLSFILSACEWTIDSANEEVGENTDDLPTDNSSTDENSGIVCFKGTSDAQRSYREVRFSFQYDDEDWHQDWMVWQDVASVTQCFKRVPDASWFRWSVDYDSDEDPDNNNSMYSCVGDEPWGDNEFVYDGESQDWSVCNKDEDGIENGCELQGTVYDR